jgi:hypothetical protein
VDVVNWLRDLSWPLVLLGGGALALAPFAPEPHLWEKLRMLFAGTLTRPLDVFDLLMHASGLALILLKAAASRR